ARIAQLQDMLAQVANPQAIQQMVDQQVTVRSLEQTIASWAAQQPHWQAVETKIPHYINMVQEEYPQLSEMDTLQRAYDMAVRAEGLGTQEAAAQAPAKPAPRRVEAAIKARSVNVKGRAGTPPPKSLDEVMEEAWARAQAR
ncbi:MAG: hypothetical protein D6811_03280, partial [Alphaproteobacteria bacterium]